MQTQEELKAYQKEYRIKNKEKLDQQAKEYRKKNADAIRERQKRYYASTTPEAKKAYRIKTKERRYELHREWCKRNKLKKLSYDMKSKFGITFDDYKRMWMEQKGCCAICGRNQKEFTERLCIDHDHNTGKVRQLLCQGCNAGIGSLREDVGTFERAIEYIKKWNS